MTASGCAVSTLRDTEDKICAGKSGSLGAGAPHGYAVAPEMLAASEDQARALAKLKLL